MTKRSAESASLHETPQKKKKRKCRSGSDAELELEAEHAQHVPALFTALLGECRRKRPRCEQLGRTAGRRPSNAADGVDEETGDVCVSGKFRRGSDACTRMRVMESNQSASGSEREERTKVPRPDDTEDQLSAFNSFQFWRTPLPALDLSLLENPSTLPEPNQDSSVKDATEAMET